MSSVNGSDKSPVIARRVSVWLLWWILLLAFWIVLDDSFAWAELLAGAGAAAIGAFLAELVLYQTGSQIRMRAEWVVPALRLPVDLIRDTVIVFAALWRRLAHGEQPRGGFREEHVRFGPSTAEARTRRSLLVGGLSVAPNKFVLGLDPERDVMVVHQLVLDEPEADQ